MSIERYNEVANSANLPAFNNKDLNDLRNLYSKKFEVPLTTASKFPEMGSTERVNIKGRVEDIQAIEARVQNGNRKAKAIAILKAVAIIGMIAAGAALATTMPYGTLPRVLGLFSLVFGSTLYLQTMLTWNNVKGREEIGKNRGKDIVLHMLTAPFYDVYTAFKFPSYYNKQRLDQIKSALVEDMETMKKALPNNLGAKELDDKKDFLKGTIPVADQIIDRGKETVKKINRLHEI